MLHVFRHLGRDLMDQRMRPQYGEDSSKEDFRSDLLQSNENRVYSPRFWGILAVPCLPAEKGRLLATERLVWLHAGLRQGSLGMLFICSVSSSASN
jgi:hypothetical protein